MRDETKFNLEFDLGGIAPWGRALNEYRAFFALDKGDLHGKILDAGAGAASFAAEASALGVRVVAVDPIYALEGTVIATRFDETARAMLAGLYAAHYRFVWTRYISPEVLVKLRREVVTRFLADYARSSRKARYVPAMLPRLPFEDDVFSLALSSHLLFLYGDVLDCDFHVAAIAELLRVAGEARIFPLVNLDGRPSAHLPEVMRRLRAHNFVPELVPIAFEFQCGANKMLRVRRDA